MYTDAVTCRKEYVGPFFILPGTSLEDVRGILSDIAGRSIEKIDFCPGCEARTRGKLVQEPDGSFSIGYDLHTLEPGVTCKNIDRGIADSMLCDIEGNPVGGPIHVEIRFL